ncbi:MFS transporter [Cuneatibacter caecimuris]|uniref:MFS transporter n=1 Tax=Cuneatibacter caecimuris TaxID=1796618 RepID=A0A4Q7PJ21_9FIRM|nr:MFS transporter [Cuneatibacter caecimuris]RZT00632.1 MFS transporter [Cuneatibacter caecimuris]
MYKELWNFKNYRKLAAANVFGRFGDSVDALVFTWLTYEISRSASLSAVVFAVNLLPTVLLQPLFAPFVDRLKKKPVMAACDCVRSALTGVFLILFALGSLQPWMMIAFTVLVNSVEAFRVPAGVSMIPQLIGREQREKAVSLNSAVSQTATIVGSAAGGLLIAVSPGAALAVDMGAFLVSGLLILWMRVDETIVRAQKEHGTGYWQQFRGGMSYLGKNRVFRLMVAGALVYNSLGAVASGLLAPYIQELLHKDAFYLSAVSVASTVAGLAAVYFYPVISKHITQRRQFVYLGFGSLVLIYGLLLLFPLMGGIPLFAAWCAGWLFFGALSGIFGNQISVKMVTAVEEEYLGRAAALFNSLGCMMAPLTSLAVAGLVNLTGMAPLLGGCLALSLAVLLIFARVPDCNLLDEQI